MHQANMALFIMGNTRKGQVKKWKNRDYRVKNNEYVVHQDVKMYCTTN